MGDRFGLIALGNASLVGEGLMIIWGLQERQVSDLQEAAEQLMTAGMLVDMTELWNIGLDGHPKRPEKVADCND